MVHESDIETSTKFLELQTMEIALNVYINKIRFYERSIRNLNMIITSEKDKDSISIYKLPNNAAGNEINSEYRISQKEEIIINIDILLKELNEFLGSN